MSLSSPETVSFENKLTNTELFTRQNELIRDKGFLIEVSAACDEAYRTSEIERLTKSGQNVEDWLQAPLFSGQEIDILISGPKSENPEQKQIYDKAQQKLAMGLAGFYALSEGLGMLSEEDSTNNYKANEILNDLVIGKEDFKDANKLSRIAHATWAAGQPYRNRETKKIMQTWDTLPPDEKNKDMIQIRAAAKVLRKKLNS